MKAFKHPPDIRMVVDAEVTRFRKEFDRQLAALIGFDAMRQLHKDTKQALLLADLVKEAA